MPGVSTNRRNWRGPLALLSRWRDHDKIVRLGLFCFSHFYPIAIAETYSLVNLTMSSSNSKAFSAMGSRLTSAKKWNYSQKGASSIIHRNHQASAPNPSLGDLKPSIKTQPTVWYYCACKSEPRLTTTTPRCKTLSMVRHATT